MADSYALHVGDAVEGTGRAVADSNTDVSDTHTFLLCCLLRASLSARMRRGTEMVGWGAMGENQAEGLERWGDLPS